MIGFAVHYRDGQVYTAEGVYEALPYAFTDSPTPLALEGGELRYLTDKPQKYDRVYPPEMPFIAHNDFHFIQTPLTLVFDLETAELWGKIVREGVSVGGLDFGWWSYGSGDGLVRLSLLEEPDLMVGYNLFGYDLPVLLNEHPDLVRRLNGYTTKRHFRWGGQTKDVDVFYSTVEAVDLYLLTLRWDVENGGKLASHSLKEVAPVFGYQRTTGHWSEHQHDLEAYLFDDVASTAFLAQKLCPPLFAQLEFVPVRPTDLGILGTGQKIDALMAASYMLEGQGIPRPRKRSRDYEGALVDANPGAYTGKIYKFDFTSLYPSIIVNEGLTPQGDRLGLFVKWVKYLRRMRVEAKRKKDAYHQNLQAAMKILINSAYGYMGATFPFADLKVAETITAKGRELVSKLRELLAGAGDVINVDTDGVVVRLHDHLDPEFVLAVVNHSLRPYQVEVEAYEAALVIAKKNYILKAGDKLVIHGNSLRNRSDEPFMRQFIQSLLTTMLTDGDLTEEELKTRIYQALTSVSVHNAYQRKTVGKFTRQHRAELVDGLEDGERVDLVKCKQGWRRKEEATQEDLDQVYYLQRLIAAVGRFGGWYEEWSKAHSGKNAMQRLVDEWGLPLAVLKKRQGTFSSPQSSK